MSDFENANLRAAFEAGKNSADAKMTTLFDVSGIHVVLTQGGQNVEPLVEAMKLADERAPAPRAIIGSSKHVELKSFTSHVNRFKDEKSAIFADTANVKLTAVFDYHSGPGAPRWGRHRSEYVCPHSRQWKLWVQNAGRLFTQEEFGEFVEANFDDIAEADGFPLALQILEMARFLIVRTKGEFSKSINQTTGESSMTQKVENDSASTKIHKAFLLKLPVFDAGEHWAVEARIRFSMPEGRPKFSYLLHNSEKVKTDAFNEIRAQVVADTELPVFAGSPEA